MADLGKAYVEIVPKAPGISGKISNLIKPGSAKAGKEGGDSAGANLVKGIKRAIIAAGIGKVVVGVFKSAIDEGGKLQQSYGGLETIYGDAAEAAKQYAKDAARAGISANDYAEQAVSFGASLKQAFKGDTTKAVEAANTAILDMTDNAAKMGTPIENIQNAYQGFAKQNYTMLDNLKLGYGGTKTEMQRLLADAQKLTGVKYDIKNLGDVYEAIHVIQGELGLSGTAASEASNTFSGSMGAMKASWANFMGALSLGEDISKPLNDLIGNASVFLQKNLIPMVVQVLKSLPKAFKEAAPILIEAVKELFTTTTTAGTAGMVTSPVDNVVQWVSHIIDVIANALVTYLPVIVETIGKLLSALWQVLKGVAPKLFEQVKSLLAKAWDAIKANAPGFLERAKEILVKVKDVIVQNAPAVIAGIKTLIEKGVQYVTDHAPEWAEKGKEMLANLGKGIVEAIPDILAAIGWLFTQLLILAADLVLIGMEWLDGLARGIWDGINTVLAPVFDAIKTAASNAWNAVKTTAANVWNSIKTAVMTPINALKTALQNVWNGIKTTTQNVWNNIKNAIMTPINAAKNAVQSAIGLIQSIINGARLELPHFKLPHFKISGGEIPWGIGGQGKKPTIDVQWYAKGGIFDDPSIIGVGEAGREAVIPMQGNNMRPFAKAIADEMGGARQTNNFYITVDGAESPEAFADRLVKQIQLRARMA